MAGNRVISAVLTLKDKDFSSNSKKATGATKELERRMKHARNTVERFRVSAVKSMKNIAKGVAVAGAATVAFGAATFAATKKVAEGFDHVAKTSRKMGVSSDFYQEMDYWAGQNGVSQNNMEKSMQRLNQRVGEARSGNKKYSGALQTLGIDMVAVKNGTLSTEDAMSQSITALSKMTNEQDKAALASELFGTKLAQELMPAIQDGSLSMEDAKKNAKELGFVIGEDTLGAAEKFNDTWDNLTRGVQAFGKKAVAGVMPFFQTAMDFAIAKLPIVQSVFSKGFSAIGGVIKFMVGIGKKSFDKLKSVMEGNKPTIDSLKNNLVKIGVAALVVRDWAVAAFGGIKKRIEENSPALEGVKSVMHDVGTKALELKDWLISAFDSAKPAISWIKDEGLPLIVDGMFAVVQKATEVYNYINDNWNAISPIVYAVGGAILFYKTGMLIATTATKIMTGVTIAMSVAQGALNAVMAISPLGWVAIAIGAVVAVGILLYKNWDTIKEAGQSLWDKLKEVWTGVETGFSNAWNAVKSAAGESLNFIIDKINSMIGVINKIPGVKIPIVAQVEWGQAEAPKGMAGLKGIDSYAVGTNRVKRDMPANIHKDEMIVPAVQSRNLRKQGVTIDNIDKPRASATVSPNTSNTSSSKNNIIININAQDRSAKDIVNEIVPLLQMRLANI